MIKPFKRMLMGTFFRMQKFPARWCTGLIAFSLIVMYMGYTVYNQQRRTFSITDSTEKVRFHQLLGHQANGTRTHDAVTSTNPPQIISTQATVDISSRKENTVLINSNNADKSNTNGNSHYNQNNDDDIAVAQLKNDFDTVTEREFGDSMVKSKQVSNGLHILNNVSNIDKDKQNSSLDISNVKEINKTTSNQNSVSVQRNVSKDTGQEEKQHVVLAKIHKAASTTMQNILLRFAMARDLNVLFSKSGNHIHEHGTKIYPDRLIKLPEGMKYDILCNHLIFNKSEIAPYFPESTMYIGIVREPFDQFKSAFIYYSQVWPYEDILPFISKYPNDPIHGFLTEAIFYGNVTLPLSSQVNNRMSVDFGFPVNNLDAARKDAKIIESFVTQVHSTFDLVLIAEMFDESLILLRRLMKWSIQDILYMKNNVYEEEASQTWTSRKEYPQEDKDMHREWAPVDYALYHLSLKIVKEKIKAEQRFEEELSVYRDIRASVNDFCLSATERNDETLNIKENEWTAEFKITRADCHLLLMGESQMVVLARNMQIKRLAPLF